jgi:hypothetical protein
MRTAHRLLLTLACLGLAAFRFPTSIDNPPPPAAPSFTLEDKRPTDDLDSGSESLSITNCAYGSYRAGAEDMTPQPADVVRDMLAVRVNDKLAGRHVELRHFTIHVNAALPLRGMVANMSTGYTGVLPDLIKGAMNERHKVGCAPDDLRGGFDLEETDKPTPLIVVVDVAVDGVDHHARCLQPSPYMSPPIAHAKPEMHATWNAAASAVVACAVDKLAAQITSGTPVALPPPPLSRAEKAKAAIAERRAREKRARDRAAGKAVEAAPATTAEAPLAVAPESAPATDVGAAAPAQEAEVPASGEVEVEYQDDAPLIVPQGQEGRP